MLAVVAAGTLAAGTAAATSESPFFSRPAAALVLLQDGADSESEAYDSLDRPAAATCLGMDCSPRTRLRYAANGQSCASERAMNSHDRGAACGEAIGSAALLTLPVKLVPKGIKAVKRPLARSERASVGFRAAKERRRRGTSKSG